jgi:hypothetical protein
MSAQLASTQLLLPRNSTLHQLLMQQLQGRRACLQGSSSLNGQAQQRGRQQQGQQQPV